MRSGRTLLALLAQALIACAGLCAIGCDADVARAPGGSAGSGSDSPGRDAGPAATPPNALAQLTFGEQAFALAVDDVRLYWTTVSNYGGAGSPAHGRRMAIRAMPKDGGSITTLAVQDGFSWDLATDETHVYWRREVCLSGPPCFGGNDPDSEDVAVWRVGKDGGLLQRLQWTTGQFGTVGPSLYLSTNAADQFTSGTIIQRSKSGAPGRVIASGQWNIGGVANDDSGVFWTHTSGASSGSVRSLAPGDGTWRSVFERAALAPGRLKLTEAEVFFRASGGVWHVPKSGGEPALLWAAPFTEPREDVDVNAGVVYWNQDPGQGHPGCLGRANLNGTDAHCLDEGEHSYRAVRADEHAVFFVRDGDVFRMRR